MPVKSMTYGTLPDEREFGRAFREHCPSGKYEISNDKGGRDGSYGVSRLYELLEDQLSKWAGSEVEGGDGGDEEAGDFCSAVLSTLGFEWI